MGKLIDQDRRRHAAADRRRRQTAILAAARTALLSQPPGELNLEALDRAAGLRQGAASMYFGSLEGLVLHLLKEETDAWLGSLEDTLREERAPIPPEHLAALLANALGHRPLLCRLLAALPAMADRRTVEMDRILDLELWRLGRLRETGHLLESLVTGLEPDDGAVLLRRAMLLAVAVEPFLNPPSGLLLAMQDEALSPLYPDAKEELRTLLASVVAAMLRSH